MTLQLEIVSEHNEIVGDDAVRVFREEGGTIGRSLQNDWILPDPDKYISGKHATIDHKGGIYYINDTSSNGVYVNDESEPIGKGNPRRLFNGDTLHFGDFEIVVSIDHGESIDIPLEEDEGIGTDNFQMLQEESLRTGVELIDEEEITGDDEFQSALFGRETKPKPEPEPESEHVEVPEIKVDDPSEPRTVEDVTATDLFDSFLDGLGLSRAELHPSADPVEIMQNAGEVLQEYVAGTEKLLASRANLKNAFRLDQTTVLPRHNNPLKLSTNTGDSIKQLLVGREGEYLGPRDSVKEVSRDLLFHQDAFLEAMTSAFVEFSERFDPDELEEAFARSSGKKPMFAFLANMKFWGLYKELYPVMTERGGGRFPQMFAEEFVRAYELQIAESLRPDMPEDLQKTVRHNVNDVRKPATADSAAANDDDEGEGEGTSENVYGTKVGAFDTGELVADELADIDLVDDSINAALASDVEEKLAGQGDN